MGWSILNEHLRHSRRNLHETELLQHFAAARLVPVGPKALKPIGPRSAGIEGWVSVVGAINQGRNLGRLGRHGVALEHLLLKALAQGMA